MPPREYLIEEIEEAETPLFVKKALVEKGLVSQNDIAALLALFENAKTFGSLIQVPSKLVAKLPEVEQRLNHVLKHGDLTHAPAHVVKPLLQQARLLARQYDAVVANPPYMGGKYFSVVLREFACTHYVDAKGDLYACFVSRGALFANTIGHIGMITIPTWMFLSSFERFRTSVLSNETICSFVHNGRGVFGSDFGSCSFVLWKPLIQGFIAKFFRLFDRKGSVASVDELAERFSSSTPFCLTQQAFQQVPTSPLCYWISTAARRAFADLPPLSNMAAFKQGLATCNNDLFVRFWHETAIEVTAIRATWNQSFRKTRKWFPFIKGGENRKWFGNQQLAVELGG